ncbi:MAG: phosphate ABC transporter permease subunit PstC [Anaerovoracaceae bacterium]|nr:phosphate ABC transporter permease subunit PstC [Anaerovoracaceae bacterium]
MKNKKRLLENTIHGIFLILGLITVGCVLLITVYLVISGIPAIKEIGLFRFLLGRTWASTAAEPSYGILPFILTSVYGTAGAILLGVPVGFLTAVYLAKIASPQWKAVMESAVNLLAGIPSVVYGLAGMLIIVPGIRAVFHIPDGASLLAAIIVLAIMILPSVIKVSMTALEAVPKEYEDASLALGATPMETYFKVSVPAAKSGIAAAVVLGVGRAIGEAMAVMMVSGNVPNMPGLFQSVRFLTTAVASEMSYKEFELLRLFLSHPGMAFTRDQLFNEIWGMDYCGETRTVDVHIRTLRQKLGDYGKMIETVRNVGYRLEATV